MPNKQTAKATPPRSKAKNPNSITELTLDPKNANKHSEFGTGLLENSLRLLGAGRSILISNDNEVIAGNGTIEAAGAIGIEKIQVVESDGTKIIAVKRTDIQSGTPEFYQMALADNVVAQKNIVMDAKMVEAIAEEYGSEVGFWTGLILEPIKMEKLSDPDKANMVQVTFQLSSSQAADLTKAIKISKQVNQTKFANQDNKNANGNALFFIVQPFLEKHKNIVVQEEPAEETLDVPIRRKAFVSREEGGRARREQKASAKKKGNKK